MEQTGCNRTYRCAKMLWVGEGEIVQTLASIKMLSRLHAQSITPETNQIFKQKESCYLHIPVGTEVTTVPRTSNPKCNTVLKNTYEMCTVPVLYRTVSIKIQTSIIKTKYRLNGFVCVCVTFYRVRYWFLKSK